MSAFASPGDQLDGRSVVTGVIGEDIHVVGLRIVEHALHAAGARVISVGVQASIPEFVDVVLESAADAVFVSSSNGHAATACDGLREALVEAGRPDILLYIGGHLVVGRSDDWGAVEAIFHELGFDRVYPPRTDPTAAIGQLASDLAERPD